MNIQRFSGPILVNRELPPLYGGSLEITVPVPLSWINFNSLLWLKGFRVYGICFFTKFPRFFQNLFFLFTKKKFLSVSKLQGYPQRTHLERRPKVFKSDDTKYYTFMTWQREKQV